MLLQVKAHLPKEYEILSQYAEVLPAGSFCPAYPFTSFIINFNVSTKLHRDWNDMEFCVVLVVSEDACEGGDLCFMEPGIRLQMKNGDIVMFRSQKITHFNMHVKGMRTSIVFHSDVAGKDWVNNRNGLKKSIYMNSYSNYDTK